MKTLKTERVDVTMAIQKFTVSRDDSVYEAWPDIVLTRGGRLICVFTECAHHKNRDRSRIVITYSDDRGRTWSEKRAFTPYSDKNFYYNDARISRMPDDTLAVICDRVDGTGQTECGPDTKIYLWTADAEGETWSDSRELPLLGIVPDKYKVLSTGRILITAHRKNALTNKNAQYLKYSDDGGESWSDEICVAADPRYHICEASILELCDGTLVSFMRENSNKGIDCLKAFSYDGGESWQGVSMMPVPACHRPVTGKLTDGRIFMTYRFIQGGNGWMNACTQNFFCALFTEETAKISERNGQSVRIMPIDYDRSATSDLGYSGWVQFDDGEIYIVNYIVDDAPKAQIRGYSMFPSDIILM